MPCVAIANYETIFVAEPEIPAEQVDQLIAKIKEVVAAHKGSVLSEDRWGRRRLAFSIRSYREGYYAVLTFNGEPTVVEALEHLYRVSDPVLRHLVIRSVEKSKKWTPRRERTGEGHRSARSGTGSRGTHAGAAASSAAPGSAGASAEASPAAPASSSISTLGADSAPLEGGKLS
jgi:small subunit ribosomal protein S6